MSSFIKEEPQGIIKNPGYVSAYLTISKCKELIRIIKKDWKQFYAQIYLGDLNVS
jgi:hypothetical protein